mmetsp:Transcript_2094/g.2808  ORF Transcript_2094/g.2808 Transcript_2094/m.2808 type:complete len:90 (+) Transcript_2094:368-637(+)
MPSHVDGTILLSTEFRYGVILRYARIPCNGRGESKKPDVNHTLDWRKGDLVSTQHYEICDEFRYRIVYVLNPSFIQCELANNSASDVCQ